MRKLSKQKVSNCSQSACEVVSNDWVNKRSGLVSKPCVHSSKFEHDNRVLNHYYSSKEKNVSNHNCLWKYPNRNPCPKAKCLFISDMFQLSSKVSDVLSRHQILLHLKHSVAASVNQVSWMFYRGGITS